MLVGFGWWDASDTVKFPRYMSVAEEAKGKEETAADGISGRVRKHVEASKQQITRHMDGEISPLKSELEGLREKVGAMESKLDAMPAKLLEAIAGAQAGE